MGTKYNKVNFIVPIYFINFFPTHFVLIYFLMNLEIGGKQRIKIGIGFDLLAVRIYSGYFKTFNCSGVLFQCILG